ncbi:jg23284 [Pararge aegeria aegeria]|uniref:Jg23284 protein n=1 Tax=Pararge aegeria aegeria TaxID=348720 RepID=A0A8S4SPF4_9NEOP|nr:jg23284 [Pararge aegeria aegeria]
MYVEAVLAQWVGLRLHFRGGSSHFDCTTGLEGRFEAASPPERSEAAELRNGLMRRGVAYCVSPPEQSEAAERSEKVNAALVDPQRGGQTTSIEALGAAGSKRPRTMAFASHKKASSGLQSVEVMMMMMT